MTESNWSTAEAGTHPNENPQGAQSSDLFDGELFGDELIDIYNAAVGEEGAEEGHASAEGIPALPSQTESAGAPDSNTEKKAETLHPGARVAETAARLDGGLGTFQSSSSLNDLTTLLSPSAPSASSSGSKTATAAGTHPGAILNATHPVATDAAHGGAAGTASTKRKAEALLAPSDPKRTATAAPVSVPYEAPAVPKPTTETATTDAHSTVVPESAVSAAQKPAPASKATEADFKTVAQAAVSSLIMSTKNGEVPTGKAESQGINTSTAHIKALTGSNWVAACSGAGAAAVAAGGGTAGAPNDAKASNRSKRQNLTADERARQNRDRNREHARNTRLRKKAYVEELKRTLTELVAQRDKAEEDKRQSARREAEQREVRFRVIEEFLNLRARNETDHSSWGAILDSKFVLTVPSTDFRAMVKGETVAETNGTGGVQLEKIYSGVDDVMNESSNFAMFLQSLGGDSESSQYSPIGFVYNCDRSNFFMDDSNAVLEWSAGTVGVTKRGAPKEITMRGSVRASFCPASNKLLAASVMFDSGAVLSQLQEFLSIPGSSTADTQAAHRADAILDSLQMPHIHKPTSVSPVVVPGESSDEGN